LAADVCLSSFGDDDWTGEPDDWLDYVEATTAQQAIDTGVFAVPPLKAELDIMWTAGDGRSMLGARKWSNQDYCSLVRFAMNSCWKYGYVSDVSVPTESIPAPAYNTRYRVVTSFADGAQSISVDGATYSATETGVPDTAGLTLTLFADRHGTGYANQAYARCYGAKIWQNGELVRDLRPCLKNGEKCFYDTVTKGYFRNATATPLDGFPIRTVIPAPGGIGDVAAFEAAMQSATRIDEIILSKGVYTLNHTISNYNAAGNSPRPVTVRGATGNRDDVVIDGQNACRCLCLAGVKTYGDPVDIPKNPEKAVKLRDLTIRNGRQLDGIEANFGCRSMVVGGGALVFYGFVENCAFVNCEAKSTSATYAYGGGLLAATAGITNCLFDTCRVETSTGSCYGGGVGHAAGGANNGFRIGNCTFTNCSAWVTGGKGSGKLPCGGAFYGPNDYVYEGIYCFECFATNTVGWDGSYHAMGGAVHCLGDRTETVFRDSYFTNCSVYGEGAAIWINNTCGLTISNTTIVGSRTYAGSSIVSCSNGRGTLESVLIEGNTTDNEGAVRILGDAFVRSSVFKDNSAFSYGAGLSVRGSLDIADCVFSGNTCTATADTQSNGGALYCWANALGKTVKIERCVFAGNSAGYGPNGYYQHGGAALRLQTVATNVVVRNCHFRQNSKSPVAMIGGGTMTADSFFRLENCSFVENEIDAIGNTYKNIISTRNDSKGDGSKYLYLENCLFFGNTGASAGVFHSSFYPDYANHVQYCASDSDVNFPAGENGNILITKQGKARDKGIDRAWMESATDAGDGTYTISAVGDYGVKVTLNNVQRRIRGAHVDIGASEQAPSGLALIVR